MVKRLQKCINQDVKQTLLYPVWTKVVWPNADWMKSRLADLSQSNTNHWCALSISTYILQFLVCNIFKHVVVSETILKFYLWNWNTILQQLLLIDWKGIHKCPLFHVVPTAVSCIGIIPSSYQKIQI